MGNWNNSQFKKYDTSKGFGSARKWKQAFNERMSFDEATEILKEQAETPYTILGVSQSATKAEIKAAFRSKVKEWHPDRNAHREAEATEMMKKINAAYTVLS